MPIVFAGVVPHPPILIPEIGKDNLKKISKTQKAMKKMEQELYSAKPESLVIISPHGNILPDTFTINLSVDYSVNFKDFGDFGVELKFKSDSSSIQKIRASDETQILAPITLVSENELDHGFGVPLYYLAQHLKNISIIPITYSALDVKQHFEFGRFLYRQLSKLNKRFAIIASGDLSHRLTEDAPAGYSKQGTVFDKKIVDIIKKNNPEGLLKLDDKLAEEAGECGLRSIAVLAGTIEPMNLQPEVLSYEGPFGVGYLVANWRVS